MKKASILEIGIAFLLTLMLMGTAFAIEVQEIARNFREKYAGVKNFSANFEQTTIVAGRKRTAMGKLSFQKPNLLRQEYSEPSNPENMTQLIVADGKMLWSYTPMINQITKQELVQDESRMELLPGFGQSLENVEKNYSLSLVADELAEKGGIHVVELTPRNPDPNNMFDALQVWIRDKDSVPVQFKYKDQKNEMTFVLSFKDVKINEKLDKSTFKFKPPKGVQVITVPNQ
jgi:outer membrane lipoprotein-sorting protein